MEENAYSFTGNDVQSIADNTWAIKIEPNFAGYYLNRGFSYQALGYYSLALQDYTKAISLDPSYDIAYNNIGIIDSNSKQYEEAISEYQQKPSKSIQILLDFIAIVERVTIVLENTIKP